MLTTIPFQGFYDSIWDSMFDSETTSFIEYEVGENQLDTPKELRLDKSDFCDAIINAQNYKALKKSVAPKYVEYLQLYLKDELSLDIKLSFDSLTSPRFYNYETDRIFANISLTNVRKLFAVSKRDKHDNFRKKISHKFTSYDGFISSYPNDLQSWLNKPIAHWDHNEVGTLLIAVMDLLDDSSDVAEMNINRDWPDSGCSEWEDSIDWPKYEADITAKREALLEAEKALQPDYVPPTPRFAKTLDLFVN